VVVGRRRALAWSSGQDYVTPGLVPPAVEAVLGHRVRVVPRDDPLTSLEEKRALQGVTAATILADALHAVPPPV
jgi:hypothetical protein